MHNEQCFTPSLRVLILMPTSKDAKSTADIFTAHNIEFFICNSLQEVCAEITKGAGIAILPEELILSDKTHILYKTLQDQPRWSAFPLLVLTPTNASTASVTALEAIGDMTLLQRPVQITELVSAVRSSLRDRQRQYKMHDYFLERDKQEEVLRASEENFRQVLNTLPAGAYTCDADGLITYYNEQATHIWGYAPKLNDTANRFCGSHKLYNADGTPMSHSESWMAMALQTDKGYIGEEKIIERPDGTKITVLAHANPIHDETGKIAGAVNILVDISERKKMENALKEADKRKDDFLAILAHELRNPLAPISNALPILQSDKFTKEIRFQAMDIIKRQVTQMIRLVDDLMDVSRIRGGKIELCKERIKVRDVITSAVETSRPLIDKNKHTLHVELPEDYVYVEADFLRLSQVISNVLNNAAKYTEAGGTIWLSVEHTRSNGIIRVRDNGIGIPAEMLPHIFDMFTQVDSSLERAQGGVGIGLMLVKNIVELHGGNVEVTSGGVGKGSEFSIHLPITLEKQNEGIADAGNDSPESRLHVLLVEDYPALAKMTAWALELDGHEVTVAQDGPTAITMAKQIIPDLILMDIGLPGMNGYELCQTLRSEPTLKNTLFIAQTGWGQEEHRQRSKEAGFDYHLVKPIDPQALRNALAALKDTHMSSSSLKLTMEACSGTPHAA